MRGLAVTALKSAALISDAVYALRAGGAAAAAEEDAIATGRANRRRTGRGVDAGNARGRGGARTRMRRRWGRFGKRGARGRGPHEEEGDARRAHGG